jgi:hypothetical protein
VRSNFTPETSKLLSDVAGLSRSPGESPEARLLRLAADPLAIFAELSGRAETAQPTPANHPEARARIAAAIMPAAHEKRENHPRPAAILHRLKATAPAVASRTYKEERAAPFQPSAADIRDAIDAPQLDRYFPALTLAAVFATAFLLWLLT